jgi:hypothetical protein
MKHKFSIFSIGLIFFACGSESTVSISQSEELDGLELEDTTYVDFESRIRPHQKKWDLNRVYADTLWFESFEDSYDYLFAVMLTRDSQEVVLAFDDYIENNLSGSTMLVEWRIDSLYEPGEEGDLYYQEHLISYEILEKGNDFGGYLREFIKAYSSATDDLMSEHINKEIGIIRTYNPGVYCALYKSDMVIEKFISWDCVIQEGEPNGDFCEGYLGVEDGLYYKEIESSDLPSFYDMSLLDDNFLQVEIPKEYEQNQLRKVTIVTKEYHYRYLYFIEIDKQWYLWIENSCDCSA